MGNNTNYLLPITNETNYNSITSRLYQFSMKLRQVASLRDATRTLQFKKIQNSKFKIKDPTDKSGGLN